MRDADASQQFHVEASNVVREYVRDRFGVPALEWTTEELMADPWTAASPTATAASRELVAGVLTSCDLVKFALAASSPADRDRLLDAAEAFVTHTQPAPATADAA